ncbi:hypothetical protein ACHWQZ_G012705 [Mnemiopsis leidyi]
MKVLLVLCALFAFSSALKCHVTGEDDAVTSTECTNEEATCSGPVFVEYTGIKDAAVKYSCGECTQEQIDAGSCKNCETAGDDCNAIDTDEDFMCDDYEFKDSAFTKKADKATCKRLKGTEAKCRKPGTKATEAAFFTSPCGPCGSDESLAKTCENGSATVVFSAVLGLLVLFNLL